MFSPPPFLVSYTAPGFPLAWEPPRPTSDEFFPFVNQGARVQHWPDFADRWDAEGMLTYCQRLAPNAQIYDVINDAYLPPGVARYPVPIATHQMPPYDVGVYAIVGDIPLPFGQHSRLYVMAGGMADFQQGLRSGLQSAYVSAVGMNWNDWGQIVSGTNAWPWDAAYALVTPESGAQEALLYWGNSSTGPVLGGLAA